MLPLQMVMQPLQTLLILMAMIWMMMSTTVRGKIRAGLKLEEVRSQYAIITKQAAMLL